MYLLPNGDVRPCCRTSEPLGNVRDSSLLDIWFGTRRADLVDELTADEIPRGCGPCAAEIAAEGRERSYPAVFERFGGAEGSPPPDDGWPARIEFNLSNRCNLMCLQCNGSLSSAIRARREGLPPLPALYGDAFFADLAAFIPHLHEAQFAGGEPFLAAENFRAWDLIGELHPDLRCVVVTNATWWNDRIERVGSERRMGFTMSIDGITRETYESIRGGSSFDRVMENVPRFVDLARANEMTAEVNFCLMRQNAHELPDLLLWAEELGMKVNASIVRAPEECSLAAVGSTRLREVADDLRGRDDEVRPQLDLNRTTWSDELERIERWAAAAPTERRRLWWSAAWSQPVEPPRPVHSSIGLLVTGLPDEEPSADEERRRIRSLPTTGALVEFEIDYDGDREVDHLISSVDGGDGDLAEVIGPWLVGRPFTSMLEEVQRLFGALVEVVLVDENLRGTETAATFERATVRSLAVRHHNGRGLLVGATVLCWLERPG
jgi:MoaA/NifB/PqqE/SkfB family radical SAM enzyme